MLKQGVLLVAVSSLVFAGNIKMDLNEEVV